MLYYWNLKTYPYEHFQAETAQKIRMVQAALKIKNGQSYKKECTCDQRDDTLQQDTHS